MPYASRAAKIRYDQNFFRSMAVRVVALLEYILGLLFLSEGNFKEINKTFSGLTRNLAIN